MIYSPLTTSGIDYWERDLRRQIQNMDFAVQNHAKNLREHLVGVQ